MKVIRPKGCLVWLGIPLISLFLVGLLTIGVWSVVSGSYLTGIIGIIISCYALVSLVAEMIIHKIVLQDTQVTIISRKHLFWFANQKKTLKFNNLLSIQVVVAPVPYHNNLAKVLQFSYTDESQDDFVDVIKFSDQQITQLMQYIKTNAKNHCNVEVEILEDSNAIDN
ncbi:MAG: hypothetical protein IKD26_02650 [Clostridia bacterium]|nr:hypothetical protein [Clostridia bacterium]